jgi:hypothetical protein
MLSVFLLFFLFIGQGLLAQETLNKTYIIKDQGSIKDAQPYIKAMSNSDMRNHRLRNTNYTIVFQGGLTIELLSANELKRNGLSIQPLDYPESFDSKRQEPVFTLGSNDFIIESYTAGSKHH